MPYPKTGSASLPVTNLRTFSRVTEGLLPAEMKTSFFRNLLSLQVIAPLISGMATVSRGITHERASKRLPSFHVTALSLFIPETKSSLVWCNAPLYNSFPTHTQCVMVHPPSCNSRIWLRKKESTGNTGMQGQSAHYSFLLSHVRSRVRNLLSVPSNHCTFLTVQK